MHFIFKLFILLFIAFPSLHADSIKEKEALELSMVISGGVSLGAYEAGYNWAMIKMLSNIKNHSQRVEPHLRSVTGASAGSINALLSAMYWCQKDEIQEKNKVNDNLFYNTWVKLGLENLIIEGKDPNNKSTLFTRDTLKLRAENILEHLNKPIYQEGCEVPLGFSVTKAKPIISTFRNSNIKIKNQHFSIPFTLKEQDGKLIILNKKMAKSSDYHISIPSIEKNNSKVIDVLFASSAFPGAFQQVKLNYRYEGQNKSSYFIDGGAYDNLPLQLAIELDKHAKDFIFIDPSNMRGEVEENVSNQKEELPIGFLNANALPLMSAVDIFQSMRLYNAINQYFGEDSEKNLILSSRYHPITGKFLGHFGAFLSEDFRIYDYYVGVYDAIYHLSQSMHSRGYFTEIPQTQLMQKLKKELGIEENYEANQAFNLFFHTEFFPNKKTQQKENKFTTIYNAFNREKNDQKRYDVTEFNHFLEKLDMHYLDDKSLFTHKSKKELEAWYKKPMSMIINRISTLENEYANVKGNSKALAKITNMMAWMGNNLIKKKEGFHIPLNIPEDKTNTNLAKVLMALPTEITTDVKNGGVGLSYNAYWYQKKGYIDAFETKVSFNQSDDISSFLRLDINAFHEYKDVIKVGMGASFFANADEKVYNINGLYGINTYVDVLDIFRISYVRRFNHPNERDYIYFGLRNIPSLIYWLQR